MHTLCQRTTVPEHVCTHVDAQRVSISHMLGLCSCPSLCLPVAHWQDCEVESFMRVSMPRLCELLTSDEGLWKENCTLVIMHWLARHGYLTPDQKGYLELLSRLQSGDCS